MKMLHTEKSTLDFLERLQTHDHCQVLDIVDGLRAQGLSSLISLPQLIVCGDQSSGKSSVLEAICGVPFPKKDNLCTRFATEVVLRRKVDSVQNEAEVSIRPGQDRSDADKRNLENFRHDMDDVRDLPSAIQMAKNAMGLGAQGANAFSTDVLRVEITGKQMPQLTIVDLPGLIHSENKFQTAQDVDLVKQLVQSYMTQPRSVILAVVSAKNDYANQVVLQQARKADPAGERTLGIITKPDTLHGDSSNERSYIELANNTDIVFKLGWHAVRNLDTSDINQEKQSRDFLEDSFFQHSNWRKLGRQSLGIVTLRNRLSEVLFAQITRELPLLMQEIETGKAECESSLARLGRSRETEEDQRTYLAEVNQKVDDICRGGCDGNYDNEFFRELDGSTQPFYARRMRAVIQNQSMAFERRLATTGSRWSLSERSDIKAGKLTREDAINRVVSLIERGRGRELPGTYNPLLISEVFQEYSTPWESLSRQFVTEVWHLASQFLNSIVRHFTDDSVYESYLRLIVQPAMDEVLIKANKALSTLFEEKKRHAMTYNHYFIENVIAKGLERQKTVLENRLRALIKDEPYTVTEDRIPSLVNKLVIESETNMDRVAAQEIFDRMQSYYQVAFKRLIDNVPIYVIENVVVQEVQAITKPIHAWKMERDLVNQIAGESHAMKAYRKQLSKKLAILTKGESICKRYAFQTELVDDISQIFQSELHDKDVGSSSDSVPGTQKSTVSTIRSYPDSNTCENLEDSEIHEEGVGSPVSVDENETGEESSVLVDSWGFGQKSITKKDKRKKKISTGV